MVVAQKNIRATQQKSRSSIITDFDMESKYKKCKKNEWILLSFLILYSLFYLVVIPSLENRQFIRNRKYESSN